MQSESAEDGDEYDDMRGWLIGAAGIACTIYLIPGNFLCGKR